MSYRSIAGSVLIALIVLLPICANAQTTLAIETGNNTSACVAAGSPSYCQAGFNGMTDTVSGVYNPAPGNVSNLDIHGLLYPGNTTLVVAHLQGWFCMNSGSTVTGSGTKCGSHIQVGYASSAPGTVDGQINDMARRGINAIVLDWYGTKISPNPHEPTAQAIRDNLDARCANDVNCPRLALMEDEGAFKWTGCPYDGAGTDRTTCISDALKQDLLYMDSNYFGRPSYLLVDATGAKSTLGRPVVAFFICEECFTNPAPNWTTIWSNVRSYANTLSKSPLFIFRNSSGFAHTQASGSFAWVNWGSSDPYGLAYLDNFYNTAVAHPSLLPMGGSWKGFDETNAPWVTSGARVMGQQCGLTWLQTFQQLAYNHDYDGSRFLPMFGIVTWNDYEEGTEVETGINNCLTLSASVSGSVLSWTPNFSSGGSEDTVHHYVIFDSIDGQNLTAIATPPSRTHAIDLATFALAQGTHTIYVKAVGQPSILNHVSNSVSYSVGVPAPLALSSVSVNPATVTAGNPSQGTVTLNGPAPGGGATVTLSSSNPAASVSGDVLIPQGANSATFTITTSSVQTVTQVTISASYGGATNTAPLTINPAPASANQFSIVVLPDTQNYNNNTSPNTFSAITNWIVSNRTSWNIQAVMGEGDITNDGSNATYWKNAAPAVQTLDNANLPYVLGLGNHDYDTMYPASGRLITGYLNDALAPASRYSQHQCAGGPAAGCWFIEGYPAGTYRNLRADVNINGKDYILLALELYPPADVLNWAEGIIASNSTAEVMITTHAFIFPDDNTRVDTCNGDPKNWGLNASNSSDAEVMWHALVRKYANVSLVVNGHFASGTTIYASHRQELGLNGNLVNQMIADYQEFPNGGNGYIRILTFDETANTISVKTYSPTLDQFLTEAKSQFTVPWHTNEPGGNATFQGWVKRASDCGAVSGATVTATASGSTFTATTLADGSFSLNVPASAGSANLYDLQVSGTGIATASDQANAFSGFPAFLKFHVSAATAVTLSTLTVNPATVSGGTSSQGTVTLSAAASSNTIVTLVSGTPATATVPTSVTVSQGATSQTFAINTSTVLSATQVTITASYAGVSKNVSLTVNPVVTGPALSSVAVNPTSVNGGTPSQGTVTLIVAATSDTMVTLVSDNATVAAVPTSVTVPQGATSQTFAINTSTVLSVTQVTITASYAGVSKTALLTVNPVVVETGQITGRISGDNGKVLRGATVSIAGPPNATVTTGNDGGYQSGQLPVGTYSVTVSKGGYASQSRSVSVTSGATTTADFILLRK